MSALNLACTVDLPPLKGTLFEMMDVELLEEPKPIPGTNKMHCLARIGSGIGIVELSVNFRRAE